tara:strand:- start:22237 stop:22668 length:432 start_codon:yes stop_codon:yes gene_type:complete
MTTTRDIIDALVSGNLKEAQRMTSDVLSEKIQDACDIEKIAVTEKRYTKKEDKLDPVDHSELKGKHKDRDDKDIDNDGDVDSSDKYLHKRRKAVSKAVKNDEGTDADIAGLALDIAKLQDRKKDLETKKAREPKKQTRGREGR